MKRIEGRLGEPKEFVEFQIDDKRAVFTQKSGCYWMVYKRSGDSFIVYPDVAPTTKAEGEAIALERAKAI